MPHKPDLPCADCGKLLWRGTTSLPEGQARCLPCRRTRKVSNAKHGTDRRYGEGCRCDVCREMKAERQRAYNARVKERDGLSPTQKQRPRGAPQDCSECGEALSYANPVATAHTICRTDKFWIADDDRLSIYDRDGFVCQLCDETVDLTLNHRDPMSATLDHILPRSLGGRNEHTNLRLAHRSCNSKRGNRVERVAG